jgi:ketol-acid reductoisomerase
MDQSEFLNGTKALEEEKKVVIVGCGAQGLNKRIEHTRVGFRYFLRFDADAISPKRTSLMHLTMVLRWGTMKN